MKKLVILGNEGVGKSSLVNALVGENVTREGGRSEAVLQFEFERNGTPFVIFDTPGFNNPLREDQSIETDIVTATDGKFDLVILCFDIRLRISKSELAIVGRFKSQPVLAVLTHCNELESSLLSQQIEDYGKIINRCLEPIVRRAIPILPAGFKHPDLPCQKDWPSKIWCIILEHVNGSLPSATEASGCSVVDSKLNEDALKIGAWLESGSKELSIIVIGKMGVGKSTLVNGLVGAEVAKVGAGAAAVSDAVVGYRMERNDISVSVFDTPGFDDPQREDEQTAEEINTAIRGKIDLVLICFDIRTRLCRSDLNILRQLNSFFNIKDWKSVLIILTFANDTNDPNDLVKAIDERKLIFQKYLIDPEYGNLSKHVAKNIPVIPAGFKHPDLPGQADWLSNLWHNAFVHVKAKQAFIKLVEGRETARTITVIGLPQERSINIGGEGERGLLLQLASTIGNLGSALGRFFQKLIT